MNARLRFVGGSAHTARPWLGVNAIDLAVGGLARVGELAPHDVEVEGLPFREVLSLTRIEGGRADNVVPDLVEATLNFRYAPHRTRPRPRPACASWPATTSRSSATRRRLRVAVDNPLLAASARAGGFPVTPKQAWTPVAQFAERGLDAVNFGPGAPRYAHTRDEQIEISALERSFEALRVFLDRLGSSVHVSPVLAAQTVYPFVRIEEAKRRKAAEGVRIFDFGMGDPREPTDPLIKAALTAALDEATGYPAAVGLPELREAIAAWARRRFDVELDPDARADPDVRLEGGDLPLRAGRARRGRRQGPRRPARARLPGLRARGALRGRRDRHVAAARGERLLPDLDAVDDETWSRTALVWVCYPNNPTGAVAPLEFYERLSEIALEHDVSSRSDEAYTELWFDDPPASALQVADRRNMVVFNTLSKRSSMTGYRCGFVAANEDVIEALRKFRPNVGTAPQVFVQRAAIAAWGDEEHVERNRALYGRKRDALRRPLRAQGDRPRRESRDDVPLGRDSRTTRRRSRSPSACSSTASSSRRVRTSGPRAKATSGSRSCRPRPSAPRRSAILEDVL